MTVSNFESEEDEPSKISYSQLTRLEEFKNEANAEAQEFESFVEMIEVEEEITITMSSQLSSSKDSVSSYRTEDDLMASSSGDSSDVRLSPGYCKPKTNSLGDMISVFIYITAVFAYERAG